MKDRTPLAIYCVLLALLAVTMVQLACSGGSSPTEPQSPSLASSQSAQASGGSGEASSSDTGTAAPEAVFGPGVFLEKLTNGIDADVAPGPSIPVGDPVEWIYVVTNIGDVPLVSLLVEDDVEGEICRRSDVPPGETFRCRKVGTASEGQYANVGTVTATDGNNRVQATDPSHYLGGGGDFAAVEIEKSTNGEDADYPVGPIVLPGSEVTWDYVVTNIGDVTLVEWVVTDDQIAGEICRGQDLQPGESVECGPETGRARDGQYENVGLVRASDGRNRVSDEDPSHYFGSVPLIAVEKKTDGSEEPELIVGCPVTWTYDVTNTGNIELQRIAVTDSEEGPVRCPKSRLASGEQMQCQLGGTVGETPYSNAVTVNAVDPVGNPAPEVSDTDGYTVRIVEPDCSSATASVESLWPPNHKLVDVEILVGDVCDRSVAVTIEGITQDEPTNGLGDGDTSPDAFGLGTSTAQLRAERSGTGDGRVYEISFSAESSGATCTGTVQVGVPHDNNGIAVDSGQDYDSTAN